MIDGIGCVTFHSLIERFGSAARALDDAEQAPGRVAALDAADRALHDAARFGMGLLPSGRSARCRSPSATSTKYPPVLWAVGDAALLDDRPRVAIVGTRRATAYGIRAARALAGAFARAGACVVSGMARGIDAAAHRAALDAGGTTIAVLGTGADLAYPAANRRPAHRNRGARPAAVGISAGRAG